MAEDTENFERDVFIIAIAIMLTHLEMIRERGEKTLPLDILKENGCRNMPEFAKKLRSLAAAINIELPAFVNDYVK